MVEGTTSASRMHKIISKSNDYTIGLLKLTTGEYTKNVVESTIDILARYSFSWLR